jgi:hypothetical protein
MKSYYTKYIQIDELNDTDGMNIADKIFLHTIDKLGKVSFCLISFLVRNFPIFRNRAYRGYAREFRDSWWKQFDWVKRTFIIWTNLIYYRKEDVVASFGPERPSPFNKYKNDGGIITVSRPGYKPSNDYKPSKKVNIGTLKKWCEENWSLKAPNSSWTIGSFDHIPPWGLCIEIAGGGITYDELFDIAENVRDYFEKPVGLKLYKSKGCWSVDFDKIEDDEIWHNVKRL